MVETAEKVEVKTAFTTKVQEKSKPTIMPERCGLAESKRNVWCIDVDPKWTIDELLELSARGR